MISRTNVDLKDLREKCSDLKLLILITNNARWHYNQYLNHLLSMNKMLERMNNKEALNEKAILDKLC